MKRIIKYEREAHWSRSNFFDVGRNSAGRVLLFLIAILFFLRLQPQAGAPQSVPRQSNRLIVLVGGSNCQILSEHLSWILPQALFCKKAPIICSAAYLCSWLADCIKESSTLSPGDSSKSNTSDVTAFNNFLFYTCVKGNRFNFYWLKKSSLFLCLPGDDHQGFANLVTSKLQSLHPLSMFPELDSFPGQLTAELIALPEQTLKKIITLLLNNSIIKSSISQSDNPAQDSQTGNQGSGTPQEVSLDITHYKGFEKKTTIPLSCMGG